jgi:hypothetical protein
MAVTSHYSSFIVSILDTRGFIVLSLLVTEFGAWSTTVGK